MGDDKATPKLRGSVMGPARDYTRRTYGEAVFAQAVEQLDDDEKKLVTGPILASALYPLAQWNHFLSVMQLTAQKDRGETADQFFRGMVRGSVGTATKTVFRFLLNLFEPTTVLARFPVMAQRIYENVTLVATVNEPGRYVCELRGSNRAVYENVRMAAMHTAVFLAEMAGAKNTEATYTKDEYTDTSFLLEGTLRYQK